MPKILIIANEPLMLAGLRDTLEFEDYEVVGALNSASDLQRGLAAAPNLVILDSTMPEVSNRYLCKQIKSKHPALPIIMLTTQEQESPGANIDPLADQYVAKPFSIRELLKLVRVTLQP